MLEILVSLCHCSTGHWFHLCLAVKYAPYNLLKDDRAAGSSCIHTNHTCSKRGHTINVENALAKLRETINTVSDEELQLGITDAFAMTRDRHTRWVNMPPYSCFYATTDVEFTFIEGDVDIAKNPTNKFKSGAGANDFGGQRTALEYLTAIYGKINRLPSEDFINFQFKSHANPEIIYTVNVPYVSIHDDECWNLGSKLYKSLPSITLPGTSETSLPVSAEQSRDSQESDTAHFSPEDHKTDIPENPERGAAIEKRSSFGQESAVSLNPTDVTEVTWGIYKPKSTNMGIIKLNSFYLEDVETKSLAIEKATMIIRSLLTNELKDTNSVMYELRGNLGGDADFADSMVQLFKPDFQSFGDCYLMNKITQNIFFDGEDPNSVNTLGQAYLRPMGVLNDGRCYSSCEVFSGSIQGHGAGTIFGEDGQTGGGGATVMELDPTLIDASPTYFKKFPFTQELTSGSTTYANTLTVGITQFIRTGLYKSQLIEDAGIEPEIIVRPRWSDLQPNPTTNTQYDRIAEHLARTGQKNGQSKLHFVCEPFEIEKPIGEFSLEVEAAGIYEFTVFQADGKTVIANKRRSLATNKQKFAIPVSTVGSALGNSHITIVGKTAGVQVLKTKRNVRTIPTNGNYMKIRNHMFIFSGLSDSVGLYQSSVTAPGDGWNNLKGPWIIGNGVKYVSRVDSSIEAFFTASVGTKINIGIDVDFDSMPDFDFFHLSVKSSDGVEDFLLRSKSRYGTNMLNGVSGMEGVVKGTAPFTTTSEMFSVSLKFTSDEAVEFAGATINSFTVSAT
ncbi:hypothetical protein BASA81_016067 [Batrachochytrium salamandrivorans]|nr:hypothetical protein BASA81_016067 [Batrachochytrium salamandrivorans]